MSGPNVVVIVRTQGLRDRFLLEAVESVLHQDYEHVSCAVVWDRREPLAGSIDFANAWWNALEAFVTRRIGANRVPLGRTAGVAHVFPAGAPVGRARAGSEGVALTRHLREGPDGDCVVEPDLVGFLDDDDVLYSGWASRLVAALEATKADAAHCDVDVVHCDEANRAKRYGHRYAGPFTLEQLRESNRTPNNAWLFRRAALEASGPGPFRQEDEPCEDYGLLLRLARAGMSWVHAPGVGAEYRIRGDEASNTPRAAMLAATERVRAAYGR